MRPATRLFAFQRRQGVFVQREAHVVGAAAQLDVVLFGAGEIEQRRAEAVFLEQAHIDLQAVVEGEADFVLAVRQNLIDAGIFQDVLGERVDVLLRV